MEISLVKAFGWSLNAIDETDIQSLLPFINRIGVTGGAGSPNKTYCDQADWL